MDRMQPALSQGMPMRDRQIRRTQPKPVPPLREQMKLRGNLRIFKSLKVNKGVLDVGRVVILGLKQERRRRLLIGQKSRVDILGSAAEPARIDDHLKVGTSFDGGCSNS